MLARRTCTRSRSRTRRRSSFPSKRASPPQTRASRCDVDGGDSLDVLVLVTAPTFVPRRASRSVVEGRHRLPPRTRWRPVASPSWPCSCCRYWEAGPRRSWRAGGWCDDEPLTPAIARHRMRPGLTAAGGAERRGDAVRVRRRLESERRPDLAAVEAVVVLELVHHLVVLAQQRVDDAHHAEQPARRDLQAIRPAGQLAGQADEALPGQRLGARRR